MKKFLYAILMVSALFFAACSSPTSSSGSDSGSGSGEQTNQSNQGNQTTYPKLLLKEGTTINTIIRDLYSTENAVAFLPSKTAPDESATVKYLDLLEEDVSIWYDNSTKNIYFYAEGVTTEGAREKLKLNENSGYMFYCCDTLTSIDLSYFDTSNVKNFSGMFNTCKSLTSLNVSAFDTSNATSLAFMFSKCEKLSTINVSKFKTDKCTDMKYMFGFCNSLTSVDVSKFNTSNVTDMQSMFSYCEQLTEVDVSNFNTSKVTNMYDMFYRCKELTVIDVSNFDTSNVTDMSTMFYENKKVKILDLSNFDTSKVTEMSHLFWWCEELTTIYASDKFVTTLAESDPYSDTFAFNKKLVGGKGTVFSNEHEGIDYAHIDGGPENPGYFTAKSE